MSKKIMSEEAVKKALAINSFREVSKEKIVDFISMIPNMDKEVAISIINQFPVYTDFANNVIATLKEMCDGIIASGDASQREIMAMYRQTLEAFEKNLNNDDCTPEERQEIRQVMILIVEQASKKDSENCAILYFLPYEIRSCLTTNLFALNLAKQTGEKKIILVEGYMDAISLYQRGFNNVVASLGTALTEEQGRLLRKYSEQVVLSYDSDGAGQEAIMRGLSILENQGCDARVLQMEGAKDPDMIKQHRILNDLVHEMDKTRPTVIAAISMCGIDEEYVHIPDVVSYNHYFGWYGGNTSMNAVDVPTKGGLFKIVALTAVLPTA